METAGGSHVRIITDIQNVLSVESQQVLKTLEGYLETTEISKGHKGKIINSLKENLNGSLKLVFSILEEKLQRNVFHYCTSETKITEKVVVDEQLAAEVKGLEELVALEKEKKMMLTQDINEGKKHLSDLENYVNFLENSEISPSEEAFLKCLKFN